MKTLLIVGLILGLYLTKARALDDDDDYESTVYADAINFVNECYARDLSLCIKERALKYLDQLPHNVDIAGGLKIKANSDIKRSSRHYDSMVLSEEPRAREDEIDNLILEKLTEYITSHTFEFRVPTDAAKDLKRSMEEGRKKKGGNNGGKGGMGNMMMLFQLKAALIGAILLKLVALVAFKALLVAKVALTIASVIALKKILEQKHHTSTYEVVSHPHYEDHGHFDRSFSSQDLAYGAHKGVKK